MDLKYFIKWKGNGMGAWQPSQTVTHRIRSCTVKSKRDLAVIPTPISYHLHFYHALRCTLLLFSFILYIPPHHNHVSPHLITSLYSSSDPTPFPPRLPHLYTIHSAAPYPYLISSDIQIAFLFIYLFVFKFREKYGKNSWWY